VNFQCHFGAEPVFKYLFCDDIRAPLILPREEKASLCAMTNGAIIIVIAPLFAGEILRGQTKRGLRAVKKSKPLQWNWRLVLHFALYLFPAENATVATLSKFIN
jgi:hypothetical protein